MSNNYAIWLRAAANDAIYCCVVVDSLTGIVDSFPVNHLSFFNSDGPEDAVMHYSPACMI